MIRFGNRVRSLYCTCQYSGQAGTYYCPVGYTLKVDMTVHAYQDERILPRLLTEEDSEPIADTEVHCHWVIEVTGLKASRPLVLQGLPDLESPAELHNRSEAFDLRMRYEMTAKSDADSNCSVKSHPEETVTVGLFRVLQMYSSRSHIIVTLTLRPQQPQTWSRVMLRALMPQTGFCSRDSLSFNGSCFAMTSEAENLTTALRNIRGSVQLAAFTSMAQISGFIAANNARLNVQPYSRPLNLSQTFRIGLFYKFSDSQIYYMAKENKECQLKLFDGQQLLRSVQAKGPCGTIGIDAKNQTVQLEFGDCQELMPSLVSFLETTASEEASSNDCTDSCDLSLELFGIPGGQNMSPKQDINYGLIALVAVPFVILLLAVLCLYKIKNNQVCCQSTHTEAETRADNQRKTSVDRTRSYEPVANSEI